MKLLLALSPLVLATAAQAVAVVPQVFGATLTPEVAGATGSGSVTATYDPTARTLALDVSWAGLSGTTTVAHIHAPTEVAGTGFVGVAVTPSTLPGFPNPGPKAGTYATTLDLSLDGTFTSGFRTLASNAGKTPEAFLIDTFYAGTAYFNLHSSTFGSGEIRGFLAPIPEPGTHALMLAGIAGVAGFARFKRKS